VGTADISVQPVLGIIPARGGSKSIPGKNLRMLAGRPLIFYAAAAARASGVVDRLILSTDSIEIAELGRTLGIEVPFMRPAELAHDDSPMQPGLEDAVRRSSSKVGRPPSLCSCSLPRRSGGRTTWFEPYPRCGRRAVIP